MTLTILKNKPVYPQRINHYFTYSIHITKSIALFHPFVFNKQFTDFCIDQRSEQRIPS